MADIGPISNIIEPSSAALSRVLRHEHATLIWGKCNSLQVIILQSVISTEYTPSIDRVNKVIKAVLAACRCKLAARCRCAATECSLQLAGSNLVSRRLHQDLETKLSIDEDDLGGASPPIYLFSLRLNTSHLSLSFRLSFHFFSS